MYGCICVKATKVYLMHTCVCMLSHDRRNLSYTSFQSTSTYLEKNFCYTYNILQNYTSLQQQQNNNNKNGCYICYLRTSYHEIFLFFFYYSKTRHNIKIVKLTYARIYTWMFETCWMLILLYGLLSPGIYDE